MRIAIDIGHNAKSDRGAAGIIKTECDLTLELGNKLKKLLHQEGHQLVNVHPKNTKSVIDSLRQRVTAANKSQADLFVSLHFNAFNKLAFGSEIFAISNKARLVARNTLTEITKLGFYDRGVKNRNFYVLKHTKMPAILVECCFCDSARDMQLYDADLMATAICNGILGKQGIYAPTHHTQMLRVKTAFTWVKPSTEQASMLPENEITKIETGMYTIDHVEPTEEHHFWVKLKSGIEGFVYAGHAEVVNK